MTKIIEYSVNQCLAMLQGLLPPGDAIPREFGKNLTNLLEAIAREENRFTKRNADLVRESDPRTALELLPDWERAFGLPDACSDDLASEDQRRKYLTTKIRACPGGASRAFFAGLAALLGYAVEISETDPHTWNVSGTQYTEQWARAGVGRCPDRICVYENDFIKCVFDMTKPAHTAITWDEY